MLKRRRLEATLHPETPPAAGSPVQGASAIEPALAGSRTGGVRRALVVCCATVALLVATAVTAAALWLVLLDPASHRDDIAAWLSQVVGRRVTVHGGVHLAVYPWLGLHIGQVAVADAEPMVSVAADGDNSTASNATSATASATASATGPAPALFATAHAAVVQVRLWPLLTEGQVELDRIILVDPVLRLRRDASGAANWDDLLALAGGDPHAPAPSDNATAPRQLRWSGVSIVNGNLLFDDALRGQRLTLSQIHCITGAGTSFEVALQCQANSTRYGVGVLDFRGQCDVDLQNGDIALTNATLALDGQLYPGLHSGRLGAAVLPLRLQTGLALDTATGVLEFRQASLDVGQERLGLDLRLENLSTPDLQASGSITRTAMPGGPKSRLWETTSVRAQFAVDPTRLTLQDFLLTSRHSSLAGNATLTFGEAPAVSLQLDAPRLDGDELAAGMGSSSGSLALEDVLAALAVGNIPGLPPPFGAAKVDAAVRVHTLTLGGQALHQLSANASLQREGLHLRLRMGEFCGSPGNPMTATATLDAKGLSASASVEDVSLSKCPDLQGLLAGGLVHAGETSLSVNATATGHSPEHWVQDWSLAASVAVDDGKLDWNRVQRWANEANASTPAGAGGFESLSLQLKAESTKRARAASPHSAQTEATLRAKGLVVEAKKPVDGVLRLSGAASIDAKSLDLQSISGAAVDLAVALPAGMLGKSATTATLKAKGDWDGPRDRLSLSSFALKAHNIQASGSATASKLGDSPVMQGATSVSVLPGALPALWPVLGLTAPQTLNPEALSRAELSTDWKVEGKRVSLSRLTARVDDTTVTGDLSFALGPDGPGNWRFQLRADRLLLDDYFSPPGNSAEAPKPWDGRSLQGLQLKGSLHLASLKLFDLHLQDMDMNLEGLPGQLRAEPLTCALAGGRVKGRMALVADRKQPGVTLSVAADMMDFELNTVATALGVGERLGGKTTLTFDLTSSGTSRAEHVQRLNGVSSLKVSNGFYGYYRTIKPEPPATGDNQLIKRNKPPEPLERPERPRRELTILNILSATGTMQWQQGVVRNNDCRLVSDKFTATGAGWLSFPAELVDYTLQIDPRIIPSFPVIIRGAMDDPDVDDSQGGTLASAVTELTGTVFRTVLDVLTLPLKTLENLKQ